jgi:hypothetical protein
VSPPGLCFLPKSLIKWQIFHVVREVKERKRREERKKKTRRKGGKEEGKGGKERRRGGKGKGKKERENMKAVIFAVILNSAGSCVGLHVFYHTF